MNRSQGERAYSFGHAGSQGDVESATRLGRRLPADLLVALECDHIALAGDDGRRHARLGGSISGRRDSRPSRLRSRILAAPRSVPDPVDGGAVSFLERICIVNQVPSDERMSYQRHDDASQGDPAGRELSVNGRDQALVAEDRAAWRRLVFLSEASAHLANSLDYETTLRRVARLAVPEMADWCVVDTIDDDGSVRLLAVAHVEPSKEALIRELRRRYPPDPHARYGLQRVLSTGEPQLYSEVQVSWRQAAARDADHLSLMQALDSRSSMCVPLRARGQTLGALTFVCASSGRRYGPEDVTLAQDLAARCALALDNARLHGQLQDTLTTRETFLASLAHDLRTPLTASLGYAQLLRRAVTRPQHRLAREQLAEWARIIETNAARAASLLDELLDIARLEGGHSLDLERRPTDLVGLVKSVADGYQLGTTRHHIAVESSQPDLVGEWDAVRLTRVFDNLLGNAVKYSPEGGAIDVRISSDDAWAIVVVTDHGLGIPEAEQARVFEHFYRGQNVAERVAGSGVGLAGARHIVEQHGGSIAVESQEGCGSRFTVRLPRT
jgi:signal transduction histidine kinase